MALFKITANSTVRSFSKAFKDEFGATLQIYDGRLKAEDNVKLVDIGAKTGTFECRASRTVGKFVEMMQQDFNLKVKVRTADDWVTVIDGLTLNRINDLPKQPTKTMMEEFVSYQRDKNIDNGLDNEETTTPDSSEKTTGLTTMDWDEDGLPIVNLKFQRYFFKKCKEEQARDFIDEEGTYPGIFIACGSEDFINHPFDNIIYVDEVSSFYLGFDCFAKNYKDETWSLLYFGNMLFAKFDKDDYPPEVRERTLSALETILEIPEEKRMTVPYDGPEAIFEIEIQDDPEISDGEVFFEKSYRIFKDEDGNWVSEQLD